MSQMMQRLKFAKGIDPIADVFDSTQRSDVFALRDHGRGLFVVHIGVGATGTSTFTVNSCPDVTPSVRTAIAFWSREILSGDTDGAITRRTSAGFTNTAGSSKLILIEVDAKDLVPGDGFVELQAVESVNSPVLGGVLFIAGAMPNRYSKDVNATIIA